MRDRTIILVVVGAIMAIVFSLMFGLPIYGVWQQGLAGEAALARAEQDRQITIREAEATRDSAVSLAEAERTRAQGVADANAIIADGLGGPDGYLRYLWIQALASNDQDLVYVPTEAQIPILEASRLR